MVRHTKEDSCHYSKREYLAAIEYLLAEIERTRGSWMQTVMEAFK